MEPVSRFLADHTENFLFGSSHELPYSLYPGFGYIFGLSWPAPVLCSRVAPEQKYWRQYIGFTAIMLFYFTNANAKLRATSGLRFVTPR